MLLFVNWLYFNWARACTRAGRRFVFTLFRPSALLSIIDY